LRALRRAGSFFTLPLPFRCCFFFFSTFARPCRRPPGLFKKSSRGGQPKPGLPSCEIRFSPSSPTSSPSGAGPKVLLQAFFQNTLVFCGCGKISRPDVPKRALKPTGLVLVFLRPVHAAPFMRSKFLLGRQAAIGSPVCLACPRFSFWFCLSVLKKLEAVRLCAAGSHLSLVWAFTRSHSPHGVCLFFCDFRDSTADYCSVRWT